MTSWSKFSLLVLASWWPPFQLTGCGGGSSTPTPPPRAPASVIARVQSGFAGDASNCNSSGLSCTLSTTVGVIQLSQAFGVGNVVELFVDGEGTAQWPAVNTITCLGNASCGTWVHISGGTVVQCGSDPGTICSSVMTGNSCQANMFDSASHHFFTDCYYLLVAGSGVTGITVTFTDSSGGSDVTNMDLFIGEYSCGSDGCPAPTIDAQSAKIYPGNGQAGGCFSCTSQPMTLTGSSDLVVQTAVFEENCDSGTCTASPYTLQLWDTSAQNATADAINTGSGASATWPQSSSGGGIFSAFALSFGTSVRGNSNAAPTAISSAGVTAGRNGFDRRRIY
jgi:hypothetical protein